MYSIFFMYPMFSMYSIHYMYKRPSYITAYSMILYTAYVIINMVLINQFDINFNYTFHSTEQLFHLIRSTLN